jgi:hypothetical protein
MLTNVSHSSAKAHVTQHRHAHSVHHQYTCAQSAPCHGAQYQVPKHRVSLHYKISDETPPATFSLLKLTL